MTNGLEVEMDEKANKIFKLYLEAILAFYKRSIFTFNDGMIMSLVERGIEDLTGKSLEETNDFRRKLAQFYLNHKPNIIRWDTNATVRDAILKYIKMDFDEYLIAKGLKHHRTIDDPWEAS